MLWLLGWFSLCLTLSLETDMDFKVFKLCTLLGLAVSAGLLGFVVVLVLP